MRGLARGASGCLHRQACHNSNLWLTALHLSAVVWRDVVLLRLQSEDELEFYLTPHLCIALQ